MAVQLVDPKQLKRIRVQLGYTQAALAVAASVSQSVVAKVEAGTVDPSFKTLSAISAALNSRAATKGKKASDVMSSPVIAMDEGSQLFECVAVMKKNAISQMPVLSRGRPIGTITEGRILTVITAANDPARLLRQRVREYVQPLFATVGRDTPVDALFSLFGYLPAVLVVSGDKVEGIITKIDLLAVAA